MKVRKLTPDDAFDVAYRMRDKDFEEIGATCLSDDRRKVATLMMMAFKNHYADGWVISDNSDNRVAIFGGTRYPERINSARVGFYATDDFHKLRSAITKLIRNNINKWAHETKVMKLDTQSLVDYDESHKWLEFFGFKRMSELPNWGGSGKTFIQFEKQINIF